MLRKIALVACLVASLLAAVLAARATASDQSTSALQCKIANYGIHADEPLGIEAVLKFKITVSACYNGRRVIRPGVTCTVWHTDPITIVNSGCSTQSFFYAWNGDPYGGYYAQAQATFQNCVLPIFKGVTCITSVTITLEIRMTANGAWIHDSKH